MVIEWKKHIEPFAAVLVVLALFGVIFIAIICAGCTATESIVREYDAEGNLLKKTYTSESIVKDVTESTKNKTLIAWENGWAAYLSASTATNEDPTPHVKMWAGKASKGVISALPEQQNWEGIAATITATREDLRVSPAGMEAKAAASDDAGGEK